MSFSPIYVSYPYGLNEPLLALISWDAASWHSHSEDPLEVIYSLSKNQPSLQSSGQFSLNLNASLSHRLTLILTKGWTLPETKLLKELVLPSPILGDVIRSKVLSSVVRVSNFQEEVFILHFATGAEPASIYVCTPRLKSVTRHLID